MGEFKISEETNRVEFKQELNDKLEREVVSFLNYPEGGTIYIGIDNNGDVAGAANTDDVKRVLDKLEIENRTLAKITSKEREQKILLIK